jgi:deazaflavin-dependent oxidoreductase (nitroreductase family)
MGRWYGITIASRYDARVLRLTSGRVRLVGPLPTALLSTTGARTGQRREIAVVYFHDVESVILIASSFGRDKHPAWFHNVRAHPQVRLNGHAFTAVEVTDMAEYERLFALAVRLYPGYGDYRERTTRIGRRIPVLRLTPR